MPLSEEVRNIISETIKNGSRELYLARNRIGADEAIALAAELKQIPNLTYLNLGGNNIGDKGGEALVQNLRHTNIIGTTLTSN